MEKEKKTREELEKQTREFLNYLHIRWYIRDELKNALDIDTKITLNPKDISYFLSHASRYSWRSWVDISNIENVKKNITFREHPININQREFNEIYELYKKRVYAYWNTCGNCHYCSLSSNGFCIRQSF